jgi:hypothetical protein
VRPQQEIVEGGAADDVGERVEAHGANGIFSLALCNWICLPCALVVAAAPKRPSPCSCVIGGRAATFCASSTTERCG